VGQVGLKPSTPSTKAFNFVRRLRRANVRIFAEVIDLGSKVGVLVFKFVATGFELVARFNPFG
jgi:acyl-coenzyme A thioesterase PaaI-like protein